MQFIRWPLAAAIALHGAAFAQALAPLKYESAFTGYQAFRDEKRAAWRDVNDTVTVLGGHNAHLRGIEAKLPAAVKALAADPHAGHHMAAPAPAPAPRAPAAKPAAPHDMKNMGGMK